MAAERTILIVDDCPEDRAEIRRLLLTGTDRRLRLVEAATGDEGVAAAAGVDAMVLDNRLPDMDALDVLRAIGAPEAGAPDGPAPNAPPLPVLVLTGDAELDSMRSLLQAGAMDYLGKRWMGPESLVQALEGAITRHALLVELAESRRALERERRSAEASRRRAEEADRHKSEFLARMSHEIRTPLSAILGYADLVHEDLDDSETRAHVDVIRRSGHALVELVDEILDLSRIEAGAVEPADRPFSPHALLADAVELLGLKAADKGIGLRLELASALPSTARGDAARLRQILLNLAGNAVKFTESGSVRVIASCAPEHRPGEGRGGGDGSVVPLRIEVVDTGIGIEPEALAWLFEPFNQADRTIVHRYGGSGLGLAISRRLATLLGGSLEVDSVPGEGSRFALEVPLRAPGPMRRRAAVPRRPARPCAPERRGDAEPPAPTASLAGVRALVVDDRAEVRELTSRRLGSAGARVTVAADGLEALAEIGTGPARFELIVMDVQMPGIDGLETVRRLRAGGCTVPVLALTANAMGDDRARCLAAGCDDYLSKPVPGARLIERAAALVAPPREGVRRRVLVVEDDPHAGALIVRALARLGHEARRAEDCRTALDLAAELAPDAVVTDLELPDGDGRLLARALRERLGRHLRVVALSGHRPTSDGIDPDFDARFVKPVDMATLAAALDP